jgi:hypothetical protein
MFLNLDETQVDELRNLLEIDLRELSYEIASADLPSYRLKLREKREVLRSILAGISGAVPVAGS